jgi:hypothetical protein
MPHGFQVISDDLDPAKTALEWPPRSPDELLQRAHNPKVAGSIPAKGKSPLKGAFFLAEV